MSEFSLENYPGLVCPQCLGQLKQQNHQLTCNACLETFPVDKQGIPVMLSAKQEISTAEVKVQDQSAGIYESCRYKLPYSRTYHEWLARKLICEIPEHSLILDNGCGQGILFDLLADDKLWGIDISIDMIHLARKKSAHVLVGNSQNLPYPSEYFDVVITRGVLHHLPNVEKGIKEINRVLKSNGIALSFDPNRALLNYLIRFLAFKKSSRFSEEHKNPSSRETKKLYQKYFDEVTLTYFGYLAYPLFGFPDFFDFPKHFPFLGKLVKPLIKLDELLSTIPIIRSQSWGNIIIAKKYKTLR